MTKLRERAKYILLGFILCLCMGIGSKLAIAKITRFKTPLEIEEKIKNFKLKQEYKNTVITRDTVKSNAERITRIEKYLFNEKGE